MRIKDELAKLKKVDVWSLMLFVLFNFQKIPEYASISELAYVLDEKNMLKLCEYFGGQTIKIPTIDELELILYAMLVYQYVDIEKIPENDAFESINVDSARLKEIKTCYKTIKKVLSSYALQPRDPI